MKIINDGIPDVIHNALLKDDYDRGESDVSVTQLIDSPKVWHLTKLHYDELEINSSSLIYALLGQTIHSILEKGCEPSDIVERRMFVKYNGWIISGQLDRFRAETQTLQDFKLSSIWEAVHGLRDERHYQTNMYALMMQLTENITPNNAEIIMIFRDWSKRKARREKDYPSIQATTIPVKLWSRAEQEQYLRDRVDLFQNYNGEPCSLEDRWESKTVYAVKKKGNKTAARGGLHATMEQAISFGKTLKDSKGNTVPYEVDVRTGEPIRCVDYCDVARFCDQYKGAADG